MATTAVELDRTSPAAFAGDLDAPAAGTYVIAATVTAPDGTTSQLTALASQSYAPEYRPGSTDEAALVEISKRSEGRGAIEPSQAFDTAALRAGRGRIALAGWLLLLAALLWPIDVALRRLSFAPGAVVSALSRARVSLPRRRARRRPAHEVAPGAAPLPDPERPHQDERVPASVERLLARKRRDAGDRDER